jgi:NAD(P)H-hydrate epimerase
MGDVLTGITAALLAQFPREPVVAAATAACVHAAAGDAAAAAGPRGLIAGDVLAALRPWLNPAQ